MVQLLFCLLAPLLLAATSCCPPPSYSCKQYQNIEGVLYSSVPCDPCSYYILFDVAVLAWQAREEGLNFALKNSPEPFTANVNVSGKMVGIDFDWEPAVKAQLSALFAKRAWDFTTRWTYFHTNTSSTSQMATAPNGRGLIPLWAFPSANLAPQFVYGNAKANWDLNLHEFDIELGYEPFITPYISLRWLGGLKILSIDQDFGVRYSNGFHSGTAQLIQADTDLTNKMTGAGPRIGFDSRWRINRGFSLIARLAGSLPLWHYRITRRDRASGVLDLVNRSIDAISRERFWTFRPVLETLIGVSWETCLGCRCQYPFGISASYEFQYFAESNMFHMLVNPGLLSLNFFPKGDLHLHGATLNFHFGF